MNTITTGKILNEVQSEIPELTDTKTAYKIINRVIRDINQQFPGILTTEDVITIIDASFSTSYTASDADPDTITIDTASYTTYANFPSGEAATDWAGYYLVISDSTSNNGSYKIATTDDSDTDNVITLSEDESITAVESAESATFQVIQVNSNYVFDTDNLLLTLSPYLQELISVTYNDGDDDYILALKTTEEVVNADRMVDADRTDIYARYNRNQIMLPEDLLSTEDDTIKIKYLKDIKPLDKLEELTSSTEITVPLSMEQVLINGVLFYLYGLSSYYNERLFETNKELYWAGLAMAKSNELRNLPIEPYTKEYNY